LQILVEPLDVTPRWDAVVADAGLVEHHRSTSWRTVAIAAVLAAALLAAAAYAAGFGDTFSSWLTGSP
jgi:amino acid permease